MRIAFHCKRHYTGKDVIHDRYGRLYEFAYKLAERGHEVRAYSMDYHQWPGDEVHHETVSAGSLTWTSRSLAGSSGVLRIASTPRWLHRELAAFRPHVIIGASDIANIWLARRLSRSLSVPYAVDLYDNFESFGQARIPGFRCALKRAVRDASLVITVSDALERKVIADYKPRGQVVVMPNGINKSAFFPGDRREARRSLGLPIDGKLIGVAGGLSRMKGMGVVYSAWRKLCLSYPEIVLVLAGPVEPGFPVPDGPRVIYLGQLAEQQVSLLFRALDVGIIAVPDSAFGRYCFPQKAFEMLACNLPVVASDVGANSDLFRSFPQILFSPEDAGHLASGIVRQLDSPVVPQIRIREWAELIEGIEPMIKRLVY